MSALNFVILPLSCVKISSGQGLVYRLTDLPTDMSKAIYPHFVEGGHNNVENFVKHHTINAAMGTTGKAKWESCSLVNFSITLHLTKIFWVGPICPIHWCFTDSARF